MEKHCILCGEVLNEKNQCPNNHDFKKMCLNCGFCSDNEGTLTCQNETNMTNALEKIKDLAKQSVNGYEISELKISPLPLKNPVLKCGQWQLSDDVKKNLEKLFK